MSVCKGLNLHVNLQAMHEEVLSRAYPAFDNAIDEVIRKRGVKKIQSSIEKQLD